VNRTDRLYAIVEELPARSPHPTSTTALADRFEVSTRTIERDVLALQEAGVPIHAATGRSGGYVLDGSRTLPPVNFTASDQAAARDLGSRVLAFTPRDVPAPRAGPDAVVPRAIERAIVDRLVLKIAYRDKLDRISEAYLTREHAPERVLPPIEIPGLEGSPVLE
jgi:predicted DNA-binding transcriptional regulator YafY